MNINISGKQLIVRKELVIALLLLLIIGVGTAGYLINDNDSGVIISSETEKTGTVKSSVIEDTVMPHEREAVEEKKNEEIKIYIVGCVKNEGVVTLEKGKLIDDAIKAAGGATPDADLKNINLVYPLTENVMLKIRSIKESELQNQAVSPASNTGSRTQASTAKPSKAGTGVVLIKDSGGALNEEPANEDKAGGKVNINTASAAELDTLSGIGEATAQKIIDYRDKVSKFKVISDIMKVSGIGQSKFDKIKDFITVD